MRILVIDDNPDIIELIRHVLSAEGYDVILARDGRQALQVAVAEQPDLVVCDVNLPGMNGWEVCRRIKDQLHVPVLQLTVRAERADYEFSQEAGADMHLSKPFEISHFLECVRELLRRSQLRRM
jgi:DNA-binding response OmpR family regulator